MAVSRGEVTLNVALDAPISPSFLADEETTAVEQAAPTFVVQTYRHPCQALSLALTGFDARVDKASSFRPLKVSVADAKPFSQFTGIDNPIAQMTHGEPHGDTLLQLGNTRGAENDTSTARGKIRGTITSRPRAERNGQQVRVPGSLGRVTGASGPPESDISLGFGVAKIHHNQECSLWQ